MKQKIRPSVVMVTFPTAIKTVIPYIHIFMVITVEDCQNSFMPHLQKVEILRLPTAEWLEMWETTSPNQ